MTLSIMILLVTLRIMILLVTLSITDAQHNDRQHNRYQVASVVMLIVVAPLFGTCTIKKPFTALIKIKVPPHSGVLSLSATPESSWARPWDPLECIRPAGLAHKYKTRLKVADSATNMPASYTAI